MDILTAKQAADELGVSVKTIRARCIRGDFPAKKIGRGWLILQSVLHDYMKGVYDQNDEPNVDGYREVKMAEGMFQWKLKQRGVWEEFHLVELKPTDIIRFKDGNKLNCDIDNLEKFTRGEHAILNRMAVNSYPEEVKPVAKNMVRLMAATSQIERGHSHD